MSVLGNVVQTLVAVAKADFGSKILPLIATAAQNLASNPNGINAAAQLVNLQSGILAALPGIAQDELKAISDAINVAVQNYASMEAQAHAAVKPA